MAEIPSRLTVHTPSTAAAPASVSLFKRLRLRGSKSNPAAGERSCLNEVCSDWKGLIGTKHSNRAIIHTLLCSVQNCNEEKCGFSVRCFTPSTKVSFRNFLFTTIVTRWRMDLHRSMSTLTRL